MLLTRPEDVLAPGEIPILVGPTTLVDGASRAPEESVCGLPRPSRPLREPSPLGGLCSLCVLVPLQTIKRNRDLPPPSLPASLPPSLNTDVSRLPAPPLVPPPLFSKDVSLPPSEASWIDYDETRNEWVRRRLVGSHP